MPEHANSTSPSQTYDLYSVTPSWLLGKKLLSSIARTRVVSLLDIVTQVHWPLPSVLYTDYQTKLPQVFFWQLKKLKHPTSNSWNMKTINAVYPSIHTYNHIYVPPIDDNMLHLRIPYLSDELPQSQEISTVRIQDIHSINHADMYQLSEYQLQIMYLVKLDEASQIEKLIHKLLEIHEELPFITMPYHKFTNETADILEEYSARLWAITNSHFCYHTPAQITQK